MSITNAHKSPSAWVLGSSIALAIALVATPAVASDEPAPTAAPSKEQSKPKPSAHEPRAKAKPRAPRRALDATARRALRASSKASDSIDGERVAMRTVAPAPDSGGDPPKRRKSKKKPSKGDDEERAASEASDRRISLDEDFLVEGKLEKPNAFYILRRSQSGYDWARLDAKFLPLVLESVQDPLF